MMVMIMMNNDELFCGMVDWYGWLTKGVFLSSGLIEWSCAVLITITPWHHSYTSAIICLEGTLLTDLKYFSWAENNKKEWVIDLGPSFNQMLHILV